MIKQKRAILFITRILPSPFAGGSQAYAYDLLLDLSKRGFDVRLLLLEPCLLEGRLPWVFEQSPGLPFRQLCPGYIKIGKRYWHLKGIFSLVRTKLSHWFKFISPCAPLPAASWGNGLSDKEKSWVRAAQCQTDWKAVICNYCWLSEALPFFGHQVQKAVLTHDVWHEHVARTSDNPHFQAMDREREQQFLNLADIIIAINGRDAEIFTSMLPQKTVVAAPMSCTVHFNDQAPKPGQLLFVGSDYKPNTDGVAWFLNEVGPLLAKNAPGRFKLNLVGAVGQTLNGCRQSIPWLAKGQVQDLHPEYAGAEIVIVPLLTGTGLKIKLVEAFAHGKAIVTTSIGAQGLEGLKGFIVADTPEEFAAQLIKISNDFQERNRLESASRKMALTNFSPVACYGELEKYLAA